MNTRKNLGMRPFSLVHLLWIITLSLFVACNNNPTGSSGSSSNNGSDANRKTTGASAHDFLSAESHSKLLIEVQYADGFKPTQQAIDSLTSFLNHRLNKPDGISVVIRNRSLIPVKVHIP